MGRKKIIIQKDILKKLYWEEGKSPAEIGQIYKCDRMTVHSRMIELNIPRRSPSQARMRYKKYNYSGDPIEKAYLIGFRLGDLNVYQKGVVSNLIVARCNTTQSVQIELMEELFSKYGRVTISKGKNSTNINCFLNTSFTFLLSNEKRVPDWIKSGIGTSNAFIAGYTDAEGNFILNQQRARFKIDTYDRDILIYISSWLIKQGIKVKLRCIAKRGQIRTDGLTFNKDLWRLNINEAFSLLKFTDIIRPYIRHKKRLRDLIVCQRNIGNRIKKGSIHYATKQY